MKLSTPLCLAAVGDRCGEGAVWSATENAIYWVDINRFLIHRLDYPSLKLKTWTFTEPVTALALTTDENRLMVSLASRLIWWWPQTDERAEHGFHLPESPAARFNDGRADPQGNFWVGSMFNNVDAEGASKPGGGSPGVLYRVDPEGVAQAKLRDIEISNTLCWSPDASLFYFADTLKNEIRAYEYDSASGDITGTSRSFFAGFERGLPDGSAIDRDGYIWNCRYGGHGIARIAPNGQLDRFIELPTANPTTCAFGGPDLSTLFITSAGYDTVPGDRLAGSLWSIETDTCGLPENKVRI
ncbi:SMP-30/gluconolactonase/LRE family protein|uniref:SMP-30/gluconolactonase/LRE family protein n=1 Tax=Pseudomonas sp. SbOxS1 TaxID=2723884 RepID=UPI0015D32D3C|nr:SMP-30/gluconolactonase/LRE family protein [Pseudomonas sp. SbOxS1]NYU05168.1 SMP-30/gluconolactonase/LRE family protein [Pseudomonas sp. SbOxS1]